MKARQLCDLLSPVVNVPAPHYLPCRGPALFSYWLRRIHDSCSAGSTVTAAKPCRFATPAKPCGIPAAPLAT